MVKEYRWLLLFTYYAYVYEKLDRLPFFFQLYYWRSKIFNFSECLVLLLVYIYIDNGLVSGKIL